MRPPGLVIGLQNCLKKSFFSENNDLTMQCNRPQSKNVCIFVQIEKYLHFWGFRGCLSQIMTLVSNRKMFAVGDSWQKMIFVLFLEKIFLKKITMVGGF